MISYRNCCFTFRTLATGLFAFAVLPLHSQTNTGMTIAANDQEVMAAIEKSKPGDTILVKSGFYKGGWTLKPGEPGKPITLKAERAGRVFVGSLDIIVGLGPVPGADYSFSRPYTTAPPKLRELDTGKELRWMAMSNAPSPEAEGAQQAKIGGPNPKETRF